MLVQRPPRARCVRATTSFPETDVLVMIVLHASSLDPFERYLSKLFINRIVCCSDFYCLYPLWGAVVMGRVIGVCGASDVGEEDFEGMQ